MQNDEPHQRETTTVDETSEGTRLDRHLSLAVPDLSRTRLKALILDGKVTIDGQTIEDPSYRVKSGEAISVEIPPTVAAKPQGQSIPLNIIHEDDDIIVIDKPAGLVVHPGAGNPDMTLVNALIAHCGDSLSGIGGVARPGIVHRIDKDTSGLLVVAKNDVAHAGLSEQFQAHSIERAYDAIAWGHLARYKGKIDAPLGRAKHHRTKIGVRKDGKHAVTHYQVMERFGHTPDTSIASLVRCTLETGRTHQIRVHMAHLGHPLIADPLYAKSRVIPTHGLSDELKQAIRTFPRQALHARILGFVHPVTGEQIRFESENPNDFNSLINAFRHEIDKGPL